MARFTRFAIDLINNQRISGWCYSRFRKKHPLKLQLFIDDVLFGEVTADEFRQDLFDLSVHPTGRCGFTYELPKRLDLASSKHLDIRVKGRKKSLVRYKSSEITKVIVSDLPRIVFMHIPKTAGTSFNTYARLFFPETKSIIHIETQKWHKKTDITAEYSYIAGHLTLEKMVQLFPVGMYTYYTIIREPYSHLHSHINWLRGIGSKVNKGFFNKHPKVIQELALKLNERGLEKTDFLEKFVRELDGLEIDGLEIDFFDNLQTRYFLKYRPDRVSSCDIENALKNISIFREIGITESYDQFTRKFCDNHNLEYVQQPQSLNRSNHSPLYDYNSARYQEIVYPLVKADLALYEKVKTK
ncbi:MAG: sulfotransferase family 2 domain-containing protein [Bacteroidetes bacterium]|nr:sulfotransferase family 2 domain-containing protein [Bacteroidota bacterium]